MMTVCWKLRRVHLGVGGCFRSSLTCAISLLSLFSLSQSSKTTERGGGVWRDEEASVLNKRKCATAVFEHAKSRCLRTHMAAHAWQCRAAAVP